MTGTVLEVVSLSQLVAQQREAGVTDVEEIAARILADLPEADLLRIIAHYIRHRVIARQRRQHIGAREEIVELTGGRRESVMRMSYGPKAWSSVWWVDGVTKETRELTPKDAETLIRVRRGQARALLLEIKFLQAMQDLARSHKAATFGDLEARGVPLPVLEEREEA